jgi:tetratricopeptide (TPR) repeat protein
MNGAAFGWLNMRRARVAQIEAQNSRSNAEKLVSFLMEDFYAELEPTGRLATLGGLAHMTVGYYDSLPPQQVTTQTRINRAMALVREGASLSQGGKVRAGNQDFDDAQAVFAKLRAAGDQGETVTYGLALALESRGSVSQLHAAPLQQAADLLRPLVYGPGSSRRVRQLYADDLNFLSHDQPFEMGIATCEEARKVLAALGALDLSDLDAASSYADTADSEARFLVGLGRLDAAQKLEQEVYDLAGKVLAQRSNDLHALDDHAEAMQLLSQVAARRHDETAAADYGQRAVQAGEDWVRFDPSNLAAWTTWALALAQVANLQQEHGEVTSAIATLHSLFALEQDKRLTAHVGLATLPQWLDLADLQAQTGDFAAATQSMQSFARHADEYAAGFRTDDPVRVLLSLADHGLSDGNLQLLEGAPKAALATATAAVAEAEQVKLPANDTVDVAVYAFFLNHNLGVAVQAAIRLGRYAQAEAVARRWLKVPVANSFSLDDPRSSSSVIDAVLAHAVALQGRSEEARQILQPALAYYREQQQAGERGTTFRHDFAYALYVSAISRPADARSRAQRNADLDQATRLIEGASAQAQKLSTLRWVTHLIAAARESQ